MPQGPGSIFVDTSHVLALLNASDQRHAAAIAWQQHLRKHRRPLVTTEFVLTEIADGLASVRFRSRAESIIRSMRADQKISIVPVTSELFEKGMALYCTRADKDWGLTDCTSFIVMSELGLSDALTSDDHFRQAGFRVLLQSVPSAVP